MYDFIVLVVKTRMRWNVLEVVQEKTQKRSAEWNGNGNGSVSSQLKLAHKEPQRNLPEIGACTIVGGRGKEGKRKGEKGKEKERKRSVRGEFRIHPGKQ
jgi:hypothetical protein